MYRSLGNDYILVTFNNKLRIVDCDTIDGEVFVSTIIHSVEQLYTELGLLCIKGNEAISIINDAFYNRVV